MNPIRLSGMAALLLPAMLAAQAPANPASDAMRMIAGRFSKNLMAAADQVPAAKLSYKPTKAQMTFGHIWAHLTEGNYGFCSAIGGVAAPKVDVPKPTASKDALVSALNASFAFCHDALAKATDAGLGEQVDMGFMNGTRALAEFIYIDDLSDHYSQVANYMRLNGMLPPTAQKRSM
ncbi:MAG TPA: DinB family protein [Gemmatimonadales bacterium]|nr:DinB family protein [Gemmatimonadales bacterium]